MLSVPKIPLMHDCFHVQVFTYFKVFAHLATSLCSLWLESAVLSDLEVKLFRCLVEQDMTFFDTHRTGELVNRWGWGERGVVLGVVN